MLNAQQSIGYIPWIIWLWLTSAAVVFAFETVSWSPDWPRTPDSPSFTSSVEITGMFHHVSLQTVQF